MTGTLSVIVPPLTYLGALVGSNGNNINRTDDKTIEVDPGTIIIGTIACSPTDPKNTTCLQAGNQYTHYVNKDAISLKTGDNTSWTTVVGKHPTMSVANLYTNTTPINETGRYFISYKYTGPDGKNSCDATTDTVLIKVVKPFAPPVLTISTNCGSTIDARATVDADSDPTEWEWVVTNDNGFDNLDNNDQGEIYGTGDYSFRLKPNTATSKLTIPNDPNCNVGGDIFPLDVTYNTTASGKDSRFFITNIDNADLEVTNGNMTGVLFDSESFDFLPTEGKVSGDVKGTSDRKLNGKWLCVRCKVDGQWTPWFYSMISGSESGTKILSGFNLGISATTCAGDNVAVSGKCSTSTKVEAGSDVTLRLYLSGEWRDMPPGESMQTVNFDNGSIKNVCGVGFVVSWQHRTKEGDPWKTFKTYDETAMLKKDASEKWYYIEEKVTNITQTTQYRAVIGRYGCFVATSQTTNPTGDLYEGKDEAGAKDVAASGGTTYGNFDDEVWVRIKTSIITGFVEGKTDIGTWNQGPDEMCSSGTLDLRLRDNGPGSLQWQFSATGAENTFTNVSGKTSATFDDAETFLLSQTHVTDQCMYQGCPGYFRVAVTNDDGETEYTNVYEVKVYKANKAYADFVTDWDAPQNIKNVLVAGICDGSSIDLAVKSSNAPLDANLNNLIDGAKPQEGYGYLEFQEITSNSLPMPSFAGSSVKTIDFNETNGYSTTVPTGSTYHAYRVAVYNGGDKAECIVYSDSIVLKKNPRVSMGRCNDVEGECANTEITLTVAGSQNVDRYDWKIPAAGGKDPEATVPVADNHTNAYTSKYPISLDFENDEYIDGLFVEGWGTFGNQSTNQPKDTVMCYAGSLDLVVTTVVCTKPAPTGSDVCAGADVVLTWAEEFKDGQQTLQYKLSSEGDNDWKDVATPNPSVSGGKTTFTVSGLAAETYVFRVNEGTTIGTASNGITVKPKPTISATDFTINTKSDDEAVCAGDKVDFAVTGETGASYKWTTDPDDDSKTVSTANPYSIASAAAGNSGTYSLVITKTADGCTSEKTVGPHTLTVNPKPEQPKVTVTSAAVCAGKSHTFNPTVTPASQTGVTYSYVWSTADNASLSTDKNLKVATTSADAGKTTAYTLTVNLFSTTAGCTETATGSGNLTVNPTPSLSNAKVTADPVCEGDSLVMKASATVIGGSIQSYEWSIDDDGDDVMTVVFEGATYSIPASLLLNQRKYTVLITAASGSGDARCIAEAETTITPVVNPKAVKPVIKDMDPLNFCQKETGHSLTAEITSAAQNPGTSTQNWYLTASTGTPVGSGLTYTLPASTYNTAGAYTYIYKQVNTTDKGCKDSAQKSVTVTVNATPSGTAVTMADVQFCSDETLSLEAKATATTGTATKYEWFKGTAATGTAEGTTTAATYTPTGITAPTTASPVSSQDYTVKVTFGANGCEDTKTATAKVTVVKKPDPITIAFNPASVEVCEGESINVTGSVTPAANGTYTLAWSPSAPGGSTNADISIASAQKSDGKTYTLKADAEHRDAVTGKRCTATQSQTITLTVNPTPVISNATLTATKDKLCTDETLSLTAAANATSGTPSYRWYKGRIADTSASNRIAGATAATYTKASPAPTDGGYYTVAITYTNGNCSATVAVEKEVTVVQKPAITSVNITPDPDPANICAGQDFSFTAAVDPATASAGNYTYQWYKGSTALSGEDGLTYGKTGAATADAGTYKFEVTATNDICITKADKTVTLAVTALPDLGSVAVSGDAKACTKLTLTADAKNAAGTSITSGVNWQWQRLNGTQWENIASATGKTYDVTAVGTGKYRCVASMGVAGTDCGKSVESPEKEVTVLEQPAITSVTVSPASPVLCQGSSLTFTATVDPATPNAGKYTYQWKKGNTNISGATDPTYAIASVATADAGTYTCTVTATNDICKDDESGSATLTVTTPANLDNITVKGAVTDKCLTDGATTLSVTGIVSGNPAQTPDYQWYKDGSPITGADKATYSVAAELASNGKYSCKLTVASTTANPCESENTTPEVDMTYKVCGTEALDPGSDPQQNNLMAVICQKGGSTGSTVSFTTTIEKDAITKLTWYKYTSAPAETSTAEGTLIKEVPVNTSTQWPLTLTQQEVFGNESAPVHYYIRAKITRGSVENFTKNYHFAKVQNAPVVNATMDPASNKVCIDKDAAFTVKGDKPNLPSINYASWGIAVTSENLTYIWTVPAGNTTSTTSSTSNKYDATTSAAVTDAEYAARVVSAYKYNVTGTPRNINASCYDTSASASGKLTVVDKPVITKLVDAGNNTSSTICADATEFPTLTATYSNGTVQKWERKATGGKTTAIAPIAAAGTNGSHALTSDDITFPDAGTTAAVINTYTVTVNNDVCDAVSKDYTLTVNPVPDLAGVDITAGDTYCNDVAHILTATPITAAGAAITATTGIAYTWEVSTDGSTWNAATGTNTGRTYTIPATTAAGTYQYRCKVEMGTGDCKVSETSDPQSFTIDAATVAGTLNQPAAVCADVDESGRPKFTLTGETGTVQKWEVSNGSATYTVPDNKTTSYTLDPTVSGIKNLLSSSVRKTPLTVTATVQNGSVCGTETVSGTVDIHTKISGLELAKTVNECNLDGNNPNVTFSPAHQTDAGESVRWEYIGSTRVENLDNVTPNTNNTTNLNFTNNTYRPKYQNDTVYTVRVRITSSVCGDVVSDPVDFTARRAPAKPAVTPLTQTVCEDGSYTVTATRPAASALTWQVSKDNGALTSVTATANGQTETLTVNPAVTGVYTYTVKDVVPDCSEESSTATVTVNERSQAGTIKAANEGVFCANENVVVSPGGTIKPSGTTINWQVSKDKNTMDNTLGRSGAAADADYSVSGFTAGTTYYIRYEVPAKAECDPAYSDWEEITILNSVTVPTLTSDYNNNVCDGTEVTLKFTAAAGLDYVLYSNTSSSNTGGKEVTHGTVDVSGTVTYTVTATATNTTTSSNYYYVKLSDPSYTGTGSCGEATSGVYTIRVDAKPQKGDLTFASNNGKTLEVNAGAADNLKLANAPIGTSTVWYAVAVNGTDFGTPASSGTITNNGIKPESFGTNRMMKTIYWVVTANGTECSSVNSDTVTVTVKSATDPDLLVASPICEKVTDAELTVIVPDALADVFDYANITWERKTASSDWEQISGVTAIGKGSLVAKDAGARTLDPGTYQYRFSYSYTNGTPGGTTEAKDLIIDATSQGGKLVTDEDVACEDGTSPILSLSGTVVGDIVAGSLKSGASETNIATSVSGGTTNTAHVYDVPTTTANVGKKYYQVMVKNGVCDAVPSEPVAVEVIAKPKPGSLTDGLTVCLLNGTAEVKLSGQQGDLITWSTSSRRNEGYIEVSDNADKTSYTVGPLSDRLWVMATLNTHAKCEPQPTAPVAVNVYDTLLPNPNQPANQTAVGENQTVTFTASATTKGLTYTDGGTFTPVTVKAYEWWMQPVGGEWQKVTGSDFVDADKATLTVNHAEKYKDYNFRCVMTSDPCDRSVTSKQAKISAVDKLYPGITNSLTDCACYYRSDQATYFVTDAAGQGKLSYDWQVSTKPEDGPAPTEGEWVMLKDVYPALYATCTLDSNKIVFPEIGEVIDQDIHWIRALVIDEYTAQQGQDPEPTTDGETIKVCLEEKPEYTFEGAIVCSREGSGSKATDFEYSASAEVSGGIQIAYAYALPGTAEFTYINVNGSEVTNSSDILATATKQVAVASGKNLTFSVTDGHLSIPASSAIPAEADGMTIRMEVRSCYTPKPLSENTDATLTATLRVDSPVAITARAQDTIVCEGKSFDMETGYTLPNKTIPGNKVTAQWYQLNKGAQGKEEYPGNADGTAVRPFETVNAGDDGVWYVDLSTENCPAVTDSITVSVRKVPAITGITPADVCAGTTATLTATIDASQASDYSLQWQRKTGNGWEDVTDGDDGEASFAGASTNTLTVTNTGADQAGEYRLRLHIELPSCKADIIEPTTTLKVKLVPEIELDRKGNVSMQDGGSRTVAVIWKTAAELGYDPAYVTVQEPTAYEWWACAAGKQETGFTQLTADNKASYDFTTGNLNQKTLNLSGNKDFDSTFFYAVAKAGCGDATTDWDTLRITDKFQISKIDLENDFCLGGDFVATVTTTLEMLPGEGCYWEVATSNGSSWSRISDGPVPGQAGASYQTSFDGTQTQYILRITRPTLAMNGWRYKATVTDGSTTDDTETGENGQEIKLKINTTLDVRQTYVAIRDIDAQPALDTGQALPGNHVTLTAENVPAGATQICFYQAFLNEAGEVDSVHKLSCGNAYTYELTQNATVAEHDATWYYVQVHNDCGYDSTSPYQLRIFDTLAIKWIPDTLIENPSGGWDYSDYDPEPGKVVVLLRPGQDSVQVAAHLWICQNEDIWFRDTTVSGFMNRESWEEPEDDATPNRGSRWFYRTSPDGEWMLFSPYDYPWNELDPIWEVQEHQGNFKSPLSPDPEFNMNGWQFRAAGVNALYSDTTCVLTLHVIPSLEEGSLAMEPAEISACYETDAEFKVTSATADLGKLTVDWQVKPAGADEWSADIDSLHNDTVYTLGRVGLDYNGYEVRAIAYGPCGGDTAYGKIVISTPVAPGVKLEGDTVCLGDELLLTAADTGQAGHSAFAWYVNGELIPGATGETFDMSDYDTGTYTVKVVMTADLTANACVRPETAEAEVSVRVNPLPTVTAAIKDEQLKTGFSTEVWVVEPDEDSYGYVWTPGNLLTDSAQTRTATVAFERAGTYDFVVTATDKTTGCQATDTVTVEVLSNFKLDSIPTTVVTPPILPNDEGTLPGFPDDSYPFFGEGVTVVSTEVFYEDEAHVWICPGNEARIVIATSGGEKPVRYSWSRVDGNAYPRDTTGTLSGWDGTGASGTDYVIEDSIIVFFFPDSTTHQFNCHITEGAGSELDITVYVHYIVPERIYIEARPKTTSTRYYEDQAVYFHARPQRYPDYYWVRVIGEDDAREVTDVRASKEAMYATSFKMEQPDERANQIWVSAIDRNGCRVWDSTSVELIKLPNVMIIGDPNRPIDNVIFPEFEVEITNMWGLRIKTFKDRNGNGSSRGWDGRTPSGVKVKAGTYYYKVKIPTLDGFVYMSGAVTVINR
ncbi:MAG: hypothetical protein NC357_08990 [Bacteroides sp.]|nr:hypothetical protein [Bacteroides sp.]